MTDLKITGKPTSGAMEALAPHVQALYDKPGRRVMAIVELTHAERLQPASASDKNPSVTVKITGCEVPNAEQEGAVREAQRALYLHRTARGTLDEAGMLDLDESTLRQTAGLLGAIETARLRAGLAHWNAYARKVVSSSAQLTQTEMAHELTAIADGLQAVLQTAAPEVDG